MSGIPKEPRQLMINLMYLVLTAMLALNVSAEIINAFFLVDKGIKKSNEVVDKSNDVVQKTIDKQADAYAANRPFAEKAKQVRKLSKEFEEYVQALRQEIIDAAGGPYKHVGADGHEHVDPDKPMDKKNKDVTTRILVTEGKAEELAKKILETKQAMLAFVDPADRRKYTSSLPLGIDSTEYSEESKTWGESKVPTWGMFTFNQMPTAAVMPILRKVQNDGKTSESVILNYLFNKVSGADKIVFDQFIPVVSAKKSYILKGDTYEAEVFLSAYSKQASNISITAGGQGLSVVEGKGTYKAKADAIGTKKYNVSISLKNPVTGKVDSYKADFEYEVGESSAAIELEKMNVFYIGVDNPISVSVAGISSNQVKVSATGVTLAPNGNSRYIVKASNPGNATITLSGGDLTKKFEYRVKRIPDPIARLGNKNGGRIGSGDFKAQAGIGAWLDNFDFDAKCDITGFEVTRVPKREDPVIQTNAGPRFSSTVTNLVNLAKPGDVYYFKDIKARCPGDAASRELNTLVFEVR